MVYKAAVANKTRMIWDVPAGHLTGLATTIYNFINIRMYNRQLTPSFNIKDELKGFI